MSSPSSIHRDFAECWNKRDFSSLQSMLHTEYAYTGSDGKELMGGPEVGIRIAKMWANAFPDAVLEVKRVYTRGDTAIAEMVARGTHKGELMGIPPTGRSIEVVLCNVMDLRDGKVYREREYMDMMSIMSQIGVFTMPGKVARA